MVAFLLIKKEQMFDIFLYNEHIFCYDEKKEQMFRSSNRIGRSPS